MLVAAKAAENLLVLAREKLCDELIVKLSAPFLLSSDVSWRRSEKRLLVLGQETFGWGGDKWCSSTARLQHWLDLEPAVASRQLAIQYAEVFGDRRTSAFWSALHEIGATLGGDWEVAWSNLMKVDTSPLSIEKGWRTCSTYWNLSYGGLDRICCWQKTLHLAELEELQPTAILSLTGPHYDYCLEKTFSQPVMRSINDWNVRAAARMTIEGIDAPVFRTYHPNYLRRAGRLRVLEDVCRAIDAG